MARSICAKARACTELQENKPWEETAAPTCETDASSGFSTS